MELYRVENLTFTYPGQFAPALRDVRPDALRGASLSRSAGFPAAAKARSSAS